MPPRSRSGSGWPITRKGLGSQERLAADGDLALGHDLRAGPTAPGRRAVDLVGEQEVAHDGTEFDVGVLAALLVDAGPDDVGGHQVGVNWMRRRCRRPPWRRSPRPGSWPHQHLRAARVPWPAARPGFAPRLVPWPTMMRLTSKIARSRVWTSPASPAAGSRRGEGGQTLGMPNRSPIRSPRGGVRAEL